MSLKRTVKRSKRAAFTLVELLVVIGIGIIIATLSITSYSKVVASGLLTTTTQAVIGLLDQARETAISRNAYVEVRVYELPAPSANPTSGTLSQFRAMQTFLVTSSGYTQLTKVLIFPTPMILQFSDYTTPSGTLSTSTTDHCTLLNNNLDASLGLRLTSGWNAPSTLLPAIGTPPSLPTYQSNYGAVVFRFTPKGNLNLDNTKQWFLTLISSTDKLTGNLPNNYATIQIDGFTGKTSYYRP
jgi:Tfp pilus assembly protein FimT